MAAILLRQLQCADREAFEPASKERNITPLYYIDFSEAFCEVSPENNFYFFSTVRWLSIADDVTPLYYIDFSEAFCEVSPENNFYFFFC